MLWFHASISSGLRGHTEFLEGFSFQTSSIYSLRRGTTLRVREKGEKGGGGEWDTHGYDLMKQIPWTGFYVLTDAASKFFERASVVREEKRGKGWKCQGSRGGGSGVRSQDGQCVMNDLTYVCMYVWHEMR